MQNHDFFQSKAFGWVILGTTGIVILILVFSLGVFVGTKKAEFSFNWAGQYYRNFAGPIGGFFEEITQPGGNFTNSNGVFGKILKVETGSLTIKDKDNTEKIVIIDDDTSIVFQKKNIELSTLKVGDTAVVIGEPNNQGQIVAKLIRIIPEPLKASKSKTSSGSK